MLGIIGIEHHRVQCVIGIYAIERAQSQEIFIDLKVESEFSKCVKTDSVEDTISYVDLAAICTQLAHEKQYQLLETYASDVLKTLLDRFKINWAWIKIKKPAAIPTAMHGYVELYAKSPKIENSAN